MAAIRQVHGKRRREARIKKRRDMRSAFFYEIKTTKKRYSFTSFF